jgi:hypothetical protein
MPTPMPAQKPSGAPLPKVPMAAANATRMATGIIVGLVIGALAGYGAGRVSVGSPGSPLSPKKGSYEEGYEAAKKKLAESGLFPVQNTETRTLSGTVKEVRSDSLVLSVELRSTNPLEELDAPKERVVAIGTDTKIISRKQKLPEKFQEEVNRFQKALSSLETGAVPPSPPEPFETVELALKDIVTGMTVSVTADVNILTLAEFTAKEIAVSDSAGPGPNFPNNTPPPPGVAP